MKNNPLLSFMLILFLAISVFTLFSYSDSPWTIHGVRLRKIAKPFQWWTNPAPVAQQDVQLLETTPRPPDVSAQSILLIGDSMVEGLMGKFRDYCLENGHTLHTVIWYSSTTQAFSDNDKLAEFVTKYKATYVVLVLGANELFVRDLDNREQYVKNILRQVEALRFIWVGPPNWKKDTGLNDCIVKNIDKDRYFPSKELQFERISDGAHPTKKSSEMWAEKIIEWIKNESRYPIKLAAPKQKYANKIRPILLNYAK